MMLQLPTVPCHTRGLGGIRTATGPTSMGNTGNPGTARWVKLCRCMNDPEPCSPRPLALCSKYTGGSYISLLKRYTQSVEKGLP